MDDAKKKGEVEAELANPRQLQVLDIPRIVDDVQGLVLTDSQLPLQSIIQ
jgi:hypothetical protein